MQADDVTDDEHRRKSGEHECTGGDQRARRQAPNMLSTEEIVGPGNLVVGIVEQSIRTDSGG